MGMIARVFLFVLPILSVSAFAQQVTLLNCESPPIKWEVKIDPTLKLIFVTPNDGLGLPPSVYSINHYGDRYIRGLYSYLDKDRTKKVDDKMSIIIDRYDQNLVWGDPDDPKGYAAYLKCQVKSRGF